MDDKFIINIDETDNKNAKNVIKWISAQGVKNRAFINSLASRLASKYLTSIGIDTSNTHNLKDIRKFIEEFDLADIILPNIRIDVRMVFDENYIFIPKSHSEYGLEPNIYMVLQLQPDKSSTKFLGFFEPKSINKNNRNNEYYFIEKEKLSSPSELKSFIENFEGSTEHTFDETETDTLENLIFAMSDDDISKEDKKLLISKLLISDELREKYIEFENFEMLSHKAVKEFDLENILDTVSDNIDQIDENINSVNEDTRSADDFDELFAEVEEPVEIVEEEEAAEDETPTAQETDELSADDITLSFDNFEPLNMETVEEPDMDEAKDVVSLDEIDKIISDNTVEENETSDFVQEIYSEDTAEPEAFIEASEVISENTVGITEEIAEPAEYEDNDISDDFDELYQSEKFEEDEADDEFSLDDNEDDDDFEFDNTEEKAGFEFTPSEALDSPYEGENISEVLDKIENISDFKEEKLEVLYNDNETAPNNNKLIDELKEEAENEEAQSLSFMKLIKKSDKKNIYMGVIFITILSCLVIYSTIFRTKAPEPIEEALPLENNLTAPEETLPLENTDIEANTPALEPISKEEMQKAKTEQKIKAKSKQTAKTKQSAGDYLTVNKISWEVPYYLSASEPFRAYLQTAGKSIKLSLSSDLLLTSDYAYSNRVKVDMTLNKDGAVENSTVITSSGSEEIDKIVLQTVKDTLNVVKPPQGEVQGNNFHLAVIINF